MRGFAFGVFVAALSLATAVRAYQVEEKSIAALQADLAAGKVTSAQLVAFYLKRIEALDRQGPALHSIIAVNPDAAVQAHKLDEERRSGKIRSPLHGIPVLIKDNIESADPMPTTAGSLALAQNLSHRDSFLAAKLRAAGAIIIGKTNLSEWANIRSAHSISGWSAIGGLVRNPYVLDRNACGSSSGSGAAIAASLAAAAIGTETDGSVTCPAAINGLVGLKPTLGLVSRKGIVPIAHSQDTAGPMTRSVAEAAALLTVIAGSDPADPATAGSDAHKRDYVQALSGADLKGKRLGVLKFALGHLPEVDRAFQSALAVLKSAGAEIIDIDYRPPKSLGDDELKVLLTELKVDLATYLATTPKSVSARTLADVIAFNKASPRELAPFGQDLFEQAEATAGLEDPRYIEARDAIKKIAGIDGIDKLIQENHLDALIGPSFPPSWRLDVVQGDNVSDGLSPLPAIAGYPHLTVPMGAVGPLPVGISFIGPAWSDDRLLALGAAFEKASSARQPPHYLATIETGEPWRSRMEPDSNRMK